jgi:hypothetical protein
MPAPRPIERCPADGVWLGVVKAKVERCPVGGWVAGHVFGVRVVHAMATAEASSMVIGVVVGCCGCGMFFFLFFCRRLVSHLFVTQEIELHTELLEAEFVSQSSMISSAADLAILKVGELCTYAIFFGPHTYTYIGTAKC